MTNPDADAQHLEIETQSIYKMNENQNGENPLKLNEVLRATFLVVTACACVAIGFTAIATCHCVGEIIKRICKKGARHVQ